MSDQKIAEDRKPEYQEEFGRINDDVELLAKPPIGRTNNALTFNGKPGESPIGRTNNALPFSGELVEPPIGMTNNAPHNTN